MLLLFNGLLAADFMTEQAFSTEKRVLMAMRKTLAKVVRDLTPADTATRYPLTDDTVSDIKACFDLIASRERELMQLAGNEGQEKPRFIDDIHKPQVVSVAGLKKKQTRESDT